MLRSTRLGVLGAVTAVLVCFSSAALGGGANVLRGTASNDTLVGTPAVDAIHAYGGDDDVYGGRGADRLYAGTGKDHVWGGDGNDLIIGGPRGDLARDTPFHRHERIYGGSGDDIIRMHVAGALVFAGPGNDRIDVRDPHSDCAVPQPGRAFAVADGPARRLDPPHCVNLVLTGAGTNFVRADDGNYDAISCQGRGDRVFADQYDRFARDECRATVIER
jgi:hypothetical protein